MSEPVVAQEGPYFEDVVEGKTYLWCSCGKSQKQPYCDGSHNGTTFAPVKYVATKTGRVMMCGCKHSKKGVICDGSHNNL